MSVRKLQVGMARDAVCVVNLKWEGEIKLEAWSSPFLTVCVHRISKIRHFHNITRVQNVLTNGITLEMDVLFS